ncbi:unnamed protein product [Spodoptera littoralis]|uniref:Uncharacterized protein n=1 Tax=Spodoptera littoralis TaxID=7109 RepID=A0A9P0IA91_SPOLI|nr:unnamed protein product [Spodoptera littoralis]
MSLLTLPKSLANTTRVHEKWLQIIQAAQDAVADDMDQQNFTAKGIRIKERAIPPEILGRNYSRYCYLINQMYDAFLNNVHLQRATYIQEIINICMKRLFELRDELVHVIVNDYVYFDAALVQLQMTPFDIEIIVPYHFPLECRKDSVEKFLQKLWADAVKRKTKGQSILDMQDQEEVYITSSSSSYQLQDSLPRIVPPPMLQIGWLEV